MARSGSTWLHFFTATEWNPGNTYGETVADGAAHPVGAYYGRCRRSSGRGDLGNRPDHRGAGLVGAALVIVERLPKRLAGGCGIVLELLAGIPSVVVGFVGQ